MHLAFALHCAQSCGDAFNILVQMYIRRIKVSTNQYQIRTVFTYVIVFVVIKGNVIGSTSCFSIFVNVVITLSPGRPILLL